MLNIVLFLLQLLPPIKTNQPSVATKDGVLFNLHQKLLLTEKFVKTEILVPYPIYNKTLEDKLINMTKEIDKMWTSENYGCPLNFTNMTDSTAGLHWIAQQTMIENKQAQHIVNLKLEMNTLLRANSQTSTTLQRQPRGAAATTEAAAALGIGIGTGDKLLCFINSVFGGCDKRVARNQKNIRQAMAYLQYLTDHGEQITIQNDEKFYVVSGELKAIKEAQNEIIETQNRNWELAEGQFKALRQNVHMRNCIQYLYVREQINQHSLVLSKIFQAILANIKTYRSALYTFRINILNALTPLMNQLLPMSLVPSEQLHEILTIVQLQQNGQQDRLSLAVPIQEILSYYETKLVTQVKAIDAGLLLTLAIPMAKSTVMNVLHAIPIPMPDGDTGKALVW